MAGKAAFGHATESKNGPLAKKENQMNNDFNELFDCEDEDEREFLRAVHQAIITMGEEVRAQTEARQEFVLAKLDEEMARLRPHAHRLLGRDAGRILKKHPQV